MIHYVMFLASFFFFFPVFSEEIEETEDDEVVIEEEENFDLGNDDKGFVVNEHIFTLEGRRIAYKTVAGLLPLYNARNQESAWIFFLAYIKNNPEAERPVTFVFPGGPGGSCTMDAICTFGPERLPLTAEGKPRRAPYFLQKNQQTLLFDTDLVYIDPVGTGYSRIVNREDARSYYTASGDIASLTQFITRYLSFFQKWNVPIFLSGMSYGTTRACGVGYNLSAMHGIPVRGLILLGSAIDFDQLDGRRNHFLPDCLLLPTFAATAWYHKKLWPEKSIQEVVEYARRFAYDEYAPAMSQPSRLDRNEREYFFKRLAEITGLSYSVIQRYNGRIDEEIFTTEFLAPERKILGGLDTRYQGHQSSIKRAWLDEDPSCREEYRGLSTSFFDYLQKKVGYIVFDRQYIAFATDQLSNWSYNITDFLEYLRRALVINPELQIFSGNGYYDCRTPFAAAEYCFEHLDLPETYRKNITFKYYEAGHGLIFDAQVLKQLHADLTEFYEK